MTAPITFTIRAFAASKSNSRKIVSTPLGKLRIIKSAAARAFVRDCKLQCPKRKDLPFTEEVLVVGRIFYPNERADLDESALLDALQSYVPKKGERGPGWPGLWKNDRLVRTRFFDHGIDARDPRIELHVEERPKDRGTLNLGWARGFEWVSMYPCHSVRTIVSTE